MVRMQWWSATRVLVVGVALALVVAASGEGCEEGGGGSSEVNCPGLGEMLSVAAVALPESELARDLEYAQEVAERVARAENGTCARAANGLGYRVTIHYTRAHEIRVRVMARSRAQRNYYRVSIEGKGAVDRDGRITRDPAATHHRLSGFSLSDVNDILDLIGKTRERNK